MSEGKDVKDRASIIKKMHKKYPGQEILLERYPDLEKGSLVYSVFGTGDNIDRFLSIFDGFYVEKGTGDSLAKRKKSLVLNEPLIFSGVKIPNCREFPGLLSGIADKFYVGKEEIGKQLRKEGLDVYADMVEKIQIKGELIKYE